MYRISLRYLSMLQYHFNRSHSMSRISQDVTWYNTFGSSYCIRYCWGGGNDQMTLQHDTLLAFNMKFVVGSNNTCYMLYRVLPKCGIKEQSPSVVPQILRIQCSLVVTICRLLRHVPFSPTLVVAVSRCNILVNL